ncbi:MAG: hypothetical protein PHC44_05485 [Lutispora sp.]|nr:hypothetical protein [Lutispora sp.]
MLKILTKKSIYFIGKFSDLIYILNSIQEKDITLKDYLIERDFIQRGD